MANHQPPRGGPPRQHPQQHPGHQQQQRPPQQQQQRPPQGQQRPPQQGQRPPQQQQRPQQPVDDFIMPDQGMVDSQFNEAAAAERETGPQAKFVKHDPPAGPDGRPYQSWRAAKKNTSSRVLLWLCPAYAPGKPLGFHYKSHFIKTRSRPQGFRVACAEEHCILCGTYFELRFTAQGATKQAVEWLKQKHEHLYNVINLSKRADQELKDGSPKNPIVSFGPRANRLLLELLQIHSVQITHPQRGTPIVYTRTKNGSEEVNYEYGVQLGQRQQLPAQLWDLCRANSLWNLEELYPRPSYDEQVAVLKELGLASNVPPAQQQAAAPAGDGYGSDGYDQGGAQDAAFDQGGYASESPGYDQAAGYAPQAAATETYADDGYAQGAAGGDYAPADPEPAPYDEAPYDSATGEVVGYADDPGPQYAPPGFDDEPPPVKYPTRAANAPPSPAQRQAPPAPQGVPAPPRQGSYSAAPPPPPSYPATAKGPPGAPPPPPGKYNPVAQGGRQSQMLTLTVPLPPHITLPDGRERCFGKHDKTMVLCQTCPPAVKPQCQEQSPGGQDAPPDNRALAELQRQLKHDQS